MAINTSYVLEQIKLEGVMHDLLAKTDGDNTTVVYGGQTKTLTAALASIAAEITALPSGSDVDGKISAAIDELIGGAPATYDTLKEIADYIAAHEDVTTAINAAIGNKVDKVEGMGLSANDFTDALKSKLDAMEPVTAAEKTAWNNKAEKTEATTEAAGLMSAADKAKLDGLNGVRYGAEVPADMKNGEMFVRIVTTGTEDIA